MAHNGFCIALYNMCGWNQGDLMISDLMKSCDILCLQETWLSSHNVNCLDVMDDVKYIAVCDKANEYVSCGRPRGGLAILWNRKYNKFVHYIGSSGSNRTMSTVISSEPFPILLLNIYWPNYNNTDYIADILLELG